MNKRVVITGVGILASNGIGKDAFWTALKEGRSGIKPVTLFDTSNLRSKTAGEITGFKAEDYLGEIGNNTMEGDIEISLIPGAKLYGALFLDDFHPDKSPFKYPGFGWAILGGILITDPLRDR